MPALRTFALVAFAASSTALFAQAPEADYTAEEIVDSLSCEAQDRPTMTDGTCGAPFTDERAFWIPGSGGSGDSSAKAPATKPRATRSSSSASSSRNLAPRRAAPAPAQVAQVKRDLLINFGNASAELTEQAKANARVFAQAINGSKLANVRFAIDGHTNAVGNADYNKDLSEKRAAALVDYLVSQGVDRSRLESEGHGYAKPMNARQPWAGENRRVEARRLD